MTFHQQPGVSLQVINALELDFRETTEHVCEFMTQHCESPIEILLGATLNTLVRLYNPMLGLRTPFVAPSFVGALHDRVQFHLQYRWGLFRSDFAAVVDFTHVILVECDGHDFHERTKEQAAHDRARDRAAQAAGYQILRFTGSEIYRDPRSCAAQIINFVLKKYQ